MAGAPTRGARVAWTFDRRNGTHPMTITTRFGRELRVPSTFQLKHQLLLFWLKNQSAKEAAESEESERAAANKDRAIAVEGSLRAMRATPTLLARADAMIE